MNYGLSSFAHFPTHCGDCVGEATPPHCCYAHLQGTDMLSPLHINVYVSPESILDLDVSAYVKIF